MQNRLLITGLTLLVLLFAGNAVQAQDKPKLQIEDPTLNAPQKYKILGVEVVGVDKNNAYIIATAGLDEGKEIRIPGSDLPNAINTLNRTGLFSDVKIYIKQKIGDGVFLLISLKEQPRLASYELKKIKRSEREDLKDMLTLLPGFAITESAKAQATNTIIRFYENKGFRYTKVDIKEELVDTSRNRAKLIITVDKGKKMEVKKLNFIGNTFYKAKKLRGNVGDLKEDRWYHIFSATTFKKEDFEKGKEELITFYRKNGFRDARIVRDSVYIYTYKKGVEAIGVDIEIYEGPRFKVRNVTWEGNTVYTDEQLSASLDLRKGDVYNQQKFEENLYFNKNNTDVSSKYQDIGYLFFQVEPKVTTVGEDSLDFHFLIAEDEKAIIKEVSFSGNTRTHDQVVRRNLRTVPGATYSRQNIQRSIRELATLSYFQPETISPNLDYDYEKKTVSIDYSMKELAGTDNFEFSGGFGGAQIGIIVSARLNFNNFSIQSINDKEAYSPLPSGDGQRLSLGVQVTGNGYQNFDIGFQEPWLFGRPNSLGINASYSLFKTTASRDELFSASVSYGQRLQWPDDYFTHTTVLQYQAYDVFGSYINEEGKVYVLNIQQIIERNSLDNFISPNSGSRLTLSGTIAPPFAGFSQFYKLKFKFSHHIPVVGKFVLTYGTEFGHLGYFGNKDRSPFEKFYLGGTPLQQRQTFTRENIDLKGYPGGFTGSISPIGQTGDLIGGNYYVKYMTELRYPAVQNEQLQLIPYLFAEGGNAFDKFYNVSPFDLKRSSGFGMRLFLPILGLIDLSYGYRFDSIPNTQVRSGNWEFLFNIGPSF
ncbi:outer membrane protein assembly factor BamA [bacterium]|nr:MAG: outer membrane protein assembly factor BamA [bacterium]